jgi:Ca-activated chloride channel family protein
MSGLARAVIVAGVLCVVPLTARPGRPQDAVPPAVFTTESNLVVLHVNVFDRRADAVASLPQTAFQVTEDGTPQTITFFSNVDVPVAVGLIVDNSTSMITRRNMVLAGTRAFAESSHPEDEVFTIVFNEHVRLGLPPTVAFTTNRMQVLAALTGYPPGGMTALHDAVIGGLEHLQEATHQKRVLVVLSDGDDNASQHADETMLERAARSDALVYAVSTADLGMRVGNPGLLKKLAERTGGVAYFPDSEDEVVEAFQEVAGNIRRGYSLGYEPTNTAHDGRFRRVTVTVRAAGYDDLKVSARDGYLAPRHTHD